MQALEDRDYFTDHSILKDPYSYFEAVRAHGPVHRLPASGIVVVTGFEEQLEVLRNTEDFSSVISTSGPAAPLPFEPRGSDISAQIEAHRGDFFGGGELLVARDDKPHAFSRSLLNRLFTPSRLKANEAFITDYSDRLVRSAAADGGCELIKDIATPFVTMVVADLLGVPDDDRQLFMDVIDAGVPPGSLNSEDLMAQNQPLVIMGGYFAGYVTDRRETPRDDILSELSNAAFPDGTTPDAMEIVRLATFLFGAGQDTSAKLLGNAMRFIVDEPGLQDRLRAEPALIPAFLEEVLRLEGSTKMTARLARRDTRIGGVEVPAGARVMLALAAGNRDPRRWDDPTALRLDRPRIREHLAFGRGAHVCIGAPLARVEVRILIEKFLALTDRIDLVEAKHGPAGARTLDYEASFIIRGLADMHLRLDPAAGVRPADAAPAGKAPRKGWF
ncbi:MAG: cytochrome P450, partial [Sphingomonas sp.]